MFVGLRPEAMAMLDICWGANRVINAKDDDQGPGQRGQHPVDVEGEGAVRLSFGKRVQVDC